ncbi:MAG: aminoacetone oxidase family FAD-binding enzyme [Peptoniphilaceae bacterium]|nr:aminoacetone oxidase family FAD-binding enzyme [Peptoniphilaceae bacterium]
MKKLAIIGAGAAGMAIAALLANQKQLAVTIYEKSDAVLRKVRATGNGRCNFTNANMDNSHYTGSEAARTEPILSNFGFQDALLFFERMGVAALTMESGMTYPQTLRAATISEALERCVSDSESRIRYQSEVCAIRKHAEYGFSVETKTDTEAFDFVVLATGGAYGIGKSEWSNGYSLVKPLGHTITRLHAGICPLLVEEEGICRRLRGLRVHAKIGFQGREYEDDLLFTEKGLSGISVFKASNAILDQPVAQRTLRIDFLPGWSKKRAVDFLLNTARSHPRWSDTELCAGLLPKSLAQELGAGIPDDADRRDRIERRIDLAKSMRFHIRGVAVKEHGQVTCGGITMKEIFSNTLESKLAPGLYFAGEVLNVQGECGGYNLHWAWASASCVADAIKCQTASRKEKQDVSNQAKVNGDDSTRRTH